MCSSYYQGNVQKMQLSIFERVAIVHCRCIRKCVIDYSYNKTVHYYVDEIEILSYYIILWMWMGRGRVAHNQSLLKQRHAIIKEKVRFSPYTFMHGILIWLRIFGFNRLTWNKAIWNRLHIVNRLTSSAKYHHNHNNNNQCSKKLAKTQNVFPI